jgi:flagellin-like protein
MIFKRGVSPLIATVLLVMITVSIGAAVMVVIQNVASEGIDSANRQQELINCGTDVSAEVIPVASRYRICVSPVAESSGLGNVTLFLENTGTKDIVGWRFTVIGGMDIYDTSSQGLDLDSGEMDGMRFNFTGTGVGIANISLIRLSPQITGGASGAITCSEPNLEWDIDAIEDWDLCTDVSWDESA